MRCGAGTGRVLPASQPAKPGGAKDDHADDQPLPDHALSGSAGGFLYVATVPSGRPAGDYTPRVVPAHAEAMIPAETRFISWYPA